MGQGDYCPGKDLEKITCSDKQLTRCSTQWSQWGEWGHCTSECQGGTRARKRECVGGDCDEIQGQDTEVEACNEEVKCPSTYSMVLFRFDVFLPNTFVSECKDEGKSKTCKKLKSKNKCDKKKAVEECKKTCGLCPDSGGLQNR